MMKILLFAGLTFVAATLVVAPVFAEPVEIEKKAQELVEPAQQVDGFFARLIEGRVDTAYDQLLLGTKIADLPKETAMLKAKTREAIRVFGGINSYETVDSKDVGKHLKRLTCLSIGKQFPIRWRFYFYNAGSAWKLIDIRIDDRLMDMFEEPAPAATGSAK
jgi:hypothetical protein